MEALRPIGFSRPFYIFGLINLLLNLGSLFAQEPIHIDPDFRSTILTANQTRLWEDTTGTLELDEIILMDAQNRLYPPQKMNMGRNFYTHWLKFQVETRTASFIFLSLS